MIYKFFPNTEFVLSTLINGHLWFSKVEDFNDPFEWDFTYKINIERDRSYIIKYIEETNVGRSTSEKEIILKKYIKCPELLERELNKSLEYRKNKGVCCFTKNEKKLDVLMWTHYANSHKGIVLGFLKDEIKIMHKNDCKTNPNNNVIFSPDLRNVIYDNITSSISPFDENRLKVRDYEYIKSEDWKSENEIRIVSPKYGLHCFNKHSLKEIIFGLNTEENFEDTIVNILKEKSGYFSVKILKCERVKGELKMKLNKY